MYSGMTSYRGESEVCYFDYITTADKDVLRLKVPMNYLYMNIYLHMHTKIWASV
jgi:hypothetical protein